jgi:diguanylate cyclase (GGDEF)-like protein
MDYQAWLEGVDALASLYSFDILPDGSFSEIRLMGVNKQNVGMLHFRPDAPEFYPGIPYRNYWMDLNFERYLYQSGSTKRSLYSYVNARGHWLKGFYIPVSSLDAPPAEDGTRTVYCLYILEYSDDIETENMSQHSADVAAAVTNISIKLHEMQDFYQQMAAAASEIKAICGAERCSIYTVDDDLHKCRFVNEDGVQQEQLEHLAAEMDCTPYEVAMRWEKALAMSDCLLLEDLKVIEERDPLWYRSLQTHQIRNIILYEIRCKRTLVGFIWAANFDTSKLLKIKSTLELSAFLLAAVIQNHQLISRLEFRSTVDGLTQVSNRNAMNDRVDRFVSGETPLPETLGIAFVDLNGLKNVNDDEGHEAGDKLLTRAAALLKIAYADHEIYRAGGDEFVVFCPDTTEKKLEHMTAQLRGLADNTPDVSFAVGTVYCNGSYDIRKAMHDADELMYRDKQEYYRQHPEKDRRKQGRGNGS